MSAMIRALLPPDSRGFVIYRLFLNGRVLVIIYKICALNFLASQYKSLYYLRCNNVKMNLLTLHFPTQWGFGHVTQWQNLLTSLLTWHVQVLSFNPQLGGMCGGGYLGSWSEYVFVLIYIFVFLGLSWSSPSAGSVGTVFVRS